MSLRPKPPTHGGEDAIWQDVEFGAYAADLPLWEQLAAEARGPVLELGSGCGRVAMHLAGAGHELIAVERDPELAAELERRATERRQTGGGSVQVLAADIAAPGWPARLQRPAALAIAPLQVLQLLDGAQRIGALGQIGRALGPGGRLAATLVDESTIGGTGPSPPPAPDMREVEGWVYSSEPLWVQVSGETLRMRRMRERVSPTGDLVRRVHDDVLHRVQPEDLEREGTEAGLSPAGRRIIAEGDYEAGSVAVILERA
ncbi:MAG: class I SAM-dependent methyltransferase [Actinobacteria bacterium]|nr:class I SAM-dependent methyltransferase [Actinomycetota bacterium]